MGKRGRKPVRVEKPCAQCGEVMLLQPQRAARRKYCSTRCAGDSQYKPLQSCRECGSEFRGKASGSGPQRYCSVECGRTAVARTQREIAAIKRIGERKGSASRLKLLDQAICDEIEALRRIARRNPLAPPSIGGPRVYRGPCKKCGSEIVVNRTKSATRTCKGCQQQAKTASKRIARATRRARERGAKAERINPWIVFIRDNWICRLCGIKTPPALRGSYENNAPELDHIQPLACGGEHTWENVQLLCRQCNLDKGATPLGQLALTGFAQVIEK